MIDPVPVVLLNLPTTVRGFVTLGSDYSPIIIINARMTAEQQKKTYQHELDHILSGQFDDDDYVEYGA